MPKNGFVLQWNNTFPFPPPLFRAFSQLPGWERLTPKVGPPVPRFNPDLPVELKDVIGVTFRFVMGEDQFLTRFAYVSSRPGNAGYNPAGLLTQISGTVLAKWKLAASEMMGVDLIVLERLNLPAENPSIFVHDPTGAGKGLLPDEALPPQIAVAFFRRTDVRSQKGRSTVFWPGATEDQNQAGIMTVAGTALWDDVNDAVHSVLTVGGDGTYTPVIAKRVIVGDPAVTTVRASAVISHVTESTFSQRATRRIGRGM